MPNLNPVVVNIKSGGSALLKTGPLDGNNVPTDPVNNFGWSMDDQTFGTLTLGSDENQNGTFQSTGKVGTVHVAAQDVFDGPPGGSGNTVIVNFTVNISAGPFGQCAPSAQVLS